MKLADMMNAPPIVGKEQRLNNRLGWYPLLGMMTSRIVGIVGM